jgi:predicted RNase H-like nuclease (RuvC/YqgF family)
MTIEELKEENARLKAEVERLKAEPDALTAYLYADTLRRDDIKTLQAQVERLTKAGDAMAGSHITLIQVYLKDSSDEWHQELHNRWNAAKEGKQP